jgi:hypothetical protein
MISPRRCNQLIIEVCPPGGTHLSNKQVWGQQYNKLNTLIGAKYRDVISGCQEENFKKWKTKICPIKSFKNAINCQENLLFCLRFGIKKMSATYGAVFLRIRSKTTGINSTFENWFPRQQKELHFIMYRWLFGCCRNSNFLHGILTRKSSRRHWIH